MMEENSIIYINYISTIIHYCGHNWSGFVNRNDGDSYLITWKLPDADEGDNEKTEIAQILKTEYANKSLITAVKIICEVKRN